VAFQPVAQRLLQRAYQSRGTWVSVRLAEPSHRQIARWRDEGIDVTAPDPVPGQLARTRWARGLVRALYREQRGRSGALRVEVGRRMPGSRSYDPANPGEGGLPPARTFRLQIALGGVVARRAVTRLPYSRRIYTDQGDPAGAHNDSTGRDW